MKKFLMCEPTGYDVNYVINPYMKHSIVDKALALRQWRSVRDAIIDTGGEVVTVEGAAAQPDMVFAANAGYLIKHRGRARYKAIGSTSLLLARFKSGHRASETALWSKRLIKSGLVGSIIAVGSASASNEAPFFEGQGDIVELDDNSVVIGFGQRTTWQGALFAEQWLNRYGIDTNLIKLKSPYYYHLDTCMFKGSLGGSYIPKAIAGSGKTLFNQSPSFEVGEEEGKTLCCNVIETSRGQLVAGILPKKVKAKYQKLGYQVTEIDTSEFLKSGGSVRCMTLDL
jgi:N-dimethylarginine dimethylaminohydrolase